VRWNESSQVLIQNSLKPADVVEISLCFELGRATVVVNEDQLSLAIGKRGQNVRLAARLTNWDIDILTPAEFTKSLDILENCIKVVEGITEEQIDRLAALGVISVFDVEEVGAEYLAESLECTVEQGEQVVQLAAERAKEVAEEQQREKEAAQLRKQQEEAELAATPGEQQAAAVLGVLGGPPAAPEGAPENQGNAASGDDGQGSIVDMLENQQPAAPADQPPPAEAEAEGPPAGVEADEAQPVEVEADEAQPVEVEADEAQPVGVEADEAQPVGVEADEAQPVEVEADEPTGDENEEAASALQEPSQS